MPVDRFGEYNVLTGNEAPGHCFFCGKALKANKRYCGKECRNTYYTEHSLKHYWPHQYAFVLQRAGGKCEKCGKEADKRTGQVHHTIPLGGHRPTWHEKHYHKNLIFLCTACHLAVHAELRRGGAVSVDT